MRRILKSKFSAGAVAVLALAGVAAAVAGTTKHRHAASSVGAAAVFAASSAPQGEAPFGHGRGGPGDELAAAAAYLGVTAAQLQSDTEGGQTLAQVASAKGKSVDGLVQALTDAETTELDAAVTAGRLTKAQEQTVLPMLKQRFTDLVNGKGGPGRRGGGFRHGGPGDELAAAAAYLGVTAAQLQSDVEGGQTLAQVASAKGKSVDGLVQALTDAETTELDAAVTAGRLTKAQEQTVLPLLKQRFTDLVNGKGGPGLRGGGFRHGDQPPADQTTTTGTSA